MAPVAEGGAPALWFERDAPLPSHLPWVGATQMSAVDGDRLWVVVTRTLRADLLDERYEIAGWVHGMLHELEQALSGNQVPVPDSLAALTSARTRPSSESLGDPRPGAVVIDGNLVIASTWQFGAATACVTISRGCWVASWAPTPTPDPDEGDDVHFTLARDLVTWEPATE